MLLLPGELALEVARYFRQARLERGHSRARASCLSGVPAATIRKFESSGQIAFRQLVMLSHAYGSPDALLALFPQNTPQTLDDLLAMSEKPARQRGRS